MNQRTGVLLWAQRVVARKGQSSYVLLEIAEGATAEQVQAAFHQIARTSHPDLHRRGLNADEIELVTSAYAMVAGAYQELRLKTRATVRMVPLRREDGMPATPPGGLPVAASTATSTPPAGTPTPTPLEDAGAASPSTSAPHAAPPPGPAMSPKAVIYFRKADLCLKRGDLKGAILQLKLAVAQDPTSSFLRTALAEVETEVRKTT